MSEQIITASDAAAGNEFASAVAMSRDGSTLVVGSPGWGPSSPDETGAAYVYTGPGFATETVLTASDGVSGDGFGWSVAVSDDGSVIVVGSLAQNPEGRAYVRSGAGWSTETILGPADPNPNYFSQSVAVSGDGLVVACGAPRWASQEGRAHVFHGASWGTHVVITPTAFPDPTIAEFGSSVALSTDGSVLAVGAPECRVFPDFGAGRVAVCGGVNWGTQTDVIPDVHNAAGFFGTSVALSGDGLTLVVGAFGNRSPGGTAYVKSGASYATETLLAPSDGVADDRFGGCVRVSEDGTVVLVGAYNGPDGNGRAYAYTGASYATETIYVASDGVSGDQFGETVALRDAALILVGAIGWGPGGSDDSTGAAYLYRPAPTGTLYGGRGGSATTSNLYTINLNTAAPTSVGPSGFALTGLACDPTSSAVTNLYGATSTHSAANPNSLVKVNRSTGAAVLLGPFALDSDNGASDIAFSDAGVLYGVGNDSGRVFTIDKSTGAGTYVNPDNEFFAGFGAIEWFEGTLYVIGQDGTVYVVDPVTDEVTIPGSVTGITSGIQAASHQGTTMLISVKNGVSAELWSVDMTAPDFTPTLLGDVFASAPPLDAIAFLRVPSTAVALQRVYGVELTITDDGLEQPALILSATQ